MISGKNQRRLFRTNKMYKFYDALFENGSVSEKKTSYLIFDI